MLKPLQGSCKRLGFCFLLLLFVLMLTTSEAATRITNFVIPEENQVRRAHRTHLFRTQSWYILRRANSISFRVTLDSALDDGQQLSFQVAPYAIIDGSSIRINHVGGGVYDITGMIPPDAPVGTFALGIKLSNHSQTRQLPKQIALLLNPYSPDDLVYYPRQEELKEYVENEHGITYRGTDAQVQDVRWYYGNFSHECLAVLLYAINKIGEKERKDPALLSRFLTKFSSQQESMPDGLMVGKWEGSFADGTNPSSWQSSDQILRTYLNQGYRSVRYSQCWVFAAVYQSLARAAGFATAQISNFNSVHEYSAERENIYMQRIGRYWERNRRYMLAETGKIWNYHSWNVVFFQNLHAPHPYNLPDWQVVDPTPQELSDGVFQMGPSPLRAIKDGKKVPFDTSFIMSEVSSRYHNFLATCQYFFYGGGRTLPPGCKVVQDLGAEPHVPSGTYIVAKAVNGFFQQSWTHMYHNRVRADDMNYLRRYNAVRAFDVFGVSEPTTGLASLESGGRRNRAMITMSNALPGTSDILNDESYNDVTVFDLHNEDEIDVNAILRHDHDEVSLYNYPDTGIAISMTIPPVKLGKPLEMFINFACEANTINYSDQLKRTDFPTKVITLAVHDDIVTDTVTDDDDDDDGEDGNNDGGHGMGNAMRSSQDYHNVNAFDVHDCPSLAMVSFRLQLEFTDYTTRHIAEIANVEANTILKQDNGFFQSYRVVITDYLEKAKIPADELIPGYVRAVLMATDHSTDPNRDIVMFATKTATVQFPTINLLTPHTNLVVIRDVTTTLSDTNDAVTVGPSPSPLTPTATPEHIVNVSITYENELPMDMTNVRLSITADNLGFDDRDILIGTLTKSTKLHHIHQFDASKSIDGLHLYTVVIESDQLSPTRAQIGFHVNTPSTESPTTLV